MTTKSDTLKLCKIQKKEDQPQALLQSCKYNFKHFWKVENEYVKKRHKNLITESLIKINRLSLLIGNKEQKSITIKISLWKKE